MSADGRATDDGDAGLPSDAGVGGEVVAGTEKDAGTEAAEREVDPAGPANLQTEPAMDMHSTSTEERIEGVVAQTRADFPQGSDPDEFERVLRQRLSQVGIDLDEERIRSIASE